MSNLISDPQSLVLKIKKSKTAIEEKCSIRPKIGLVLGSGLGLFVDNVDNKVIIPYDQIPYFHNTTVEGHAGRLILGTILDFPVVILQGRIHAYEGHQMEDLVFPIRVLASLGIDGLILTNAAGGVNTQFETGDLICISDHINLMGKNPLIGPNINEMGPRFPDMTHAYNQEYQNDLVKSAGELGIKMKKGVYVGLLGPTYETPAEIRMIRTLGGDMVGMSTVPESIAANHLGIKVCGISCITNMAAGILDVRLKHEDIKEEAFKVMERFTGLLKLFIKKQKDHYEK